MTSNSATYPSLPKLRTSVTPHSIVPSVVLINDLLNEFETAQDAAWIDVLHIRDEIIDTAIQICYENYVERQAIKFFVQCSYEAWMRILRLKFYSHDSRIEFYDRYPKFGPDQHPTPSIPDTWAAKTIQINDPQFHVDDEEITSIDEEDYNITQQIKKTTIAINGDQHTNISHDSHLSEKDSLKSNSDVSEKFQVQEEVVDDITGPNPSEISLEALESVSTISSRTTSYFTSIATASAKRETLPAVLSRTMPHKDRRSKHKLDKIKIQYTCNDTQRPKNIQLEDLPPVRAPTTFKYNVFTEEERKTMEDEKNNKLNKN